MNQIKIYDVAGAAGVSLATVSRVLNHPEKVKPATRDKIEKIIKELGYKPNLNAKGLASNKSTTVAIVVPELARSSIAEIVNGIADCAARRGYLLRLFVTGKSDDALVDEKELWGEIFASGVDGILYINDEMTQEQEEMLLDVPVPVVLTNTQCSSPLIPMVSLDYKKAAYDITKEMIKRGNKNIWMIKTIRTYVMNNLKVEGYLQAMKEEGLEPKVIEVSGKTELNEPAYAELLEKEGTPDVAIIVRDSMAVSFLNVARLHHVSIPNDLQVIGFQNTRYAELSRPKLSCVNTPIYEIGEKAMDLLTTLMESEEEEYDGELQQYVEYDMVWRETTK